MTDEAAIVAAFATKLKALRQAQGLTLEGLAVASGVSVSSLSKIENRQQSPSFETVLRIARTLKINFVDLLEQDAPQPGSLARRVITRAAEAPAFASRWYNYATHAAELRRKAMVPLLIRIETRVPPPLDEWSIHAGEEFIYVLEGTLAFHTEHYAQATLNPGDSCYLDSTMRHAFVTASENDVLLLSVCSSVIPFVDARGRRIDLLSTD